MTIGMIAFSQRGLDLGKRLQQALSDHAVELCRCENGGLAQWTQSQFAQADALVFIGATGIAVRAVAPHIQSKTTDPAVLVLDELGRHVIPLLSGHIGGANALALTIARAMGAIPVITTATDINGVFAVDNWAKSQGLTIVNPERIKWVSARLLSGETIRMKSLFPVSGKLPEGIVLDDHDYDVLISHRTRGRADALRLVPKIATVGMGCKKDVPAEVLEEAFRMVLQKASCCPEAVAQIASIDRKAQEPGILSLCQTHHLPYSTFSAGQLAAVPGNFSGSSFVKSVTGVDNVCERSAVLASGGTLLTKKEAGHGVTMALALAPFTLHFEEES